MMSTLKSSAVNPVQLDDFCRLCLLQKPDLHPLSRQIQTMMIPEMLFKVTGMLLNVHDQLPRVICERCLVKLELAFTTAEEFRKQEELLRRLWWKGALVDQLIEYQQSEESRRTPYSEELTERLAAIVEVKKIAVSEQLGSIVPIDKQLQIVKDEPLDVDEFSIEELPYEPINEAAAQPEWKQQPNEIIDNGLEMVLELEDLRTIGALPDALLEQLDMQQIKDDDPKNAGSGGYFITSSVASETEQSDDDKDTDYVPDVVEGDSKDPFRCKICNKHYEAPEELNAHFVRHEPGSKPWKLQCKYCPQRFQRQSYREIHEKGHENRLAAGLPEPNQGPHKCTICFRRYLTIHQFNYHMLRHEHKAMGTFRCSVCGHIFGTQVELKNHERKHETKPEWRIGRDKIPPPGIVKQDKKTLYKCGECENLFANRFKYFQHAQTHIVRKAGLFQCQDCGKSYGAKRFLLTHQRKVHNLSNKPDPDKKVTTAGMHKEPAPPEEIKIKLGTLAEDLVSSSYQKPPVDDKPEDSDEDCLLVEDASPAVRPSSSGEHTEASNVTYKWEINKSASTPFYELKAYYKG